MNEIYGIDPEVPAKWNDIHVLTLLFGIHQGRFIASYPSEDWEFFLFKNISDLKDIEQSKAKRKIEQLRDAYYPLEAEYRRTKKWIDNVYEFQSKNKALAQVFTDPANQYQYPSLKDLLDGSTDLPDGSGKRIEMTVHSYRKVLKPLFLKSTELHFIDRFFHLRDEDGNKRTLTKSLKALGLMICKLNLHFRVLISGMIDVFLVSREVLVLIRDLILHLT